MVNANIQLGKNGVSDNFILTLQSHFKNHSNIKVNVLKNARGDGKEGREKVKEYSNEILNKLGNKFTARIIGFTINLKKWRKPQR